MLVVGMRLAKCTKLQVIANCTRVKVAADIGIRALTKRPVSRVAAMNHDVRYLGECSTHFASTMSCGQRFYQRPVRPLLLLEDGKITLICSYFGER